MAARRRADVDLNPAGDRHGNQQRRCRVAADRRVTVAAGTASVSAVVDLTTAGVVGGFQVPPTPPGSTGFSDPATMDGRPTDALWQNGHFAFVSTDACVPAGDTASRDCVRATVLDTATATPTRVEDTDLGYTGYHFFMGGIGFAADGTQFLVFSVSSSTTTYRPTPPPSSQAIPQTPIGR